MFNIFQQPLEHETLDDWAKISADCAKVAILGIPVILYGNETFSHKLFYIFLLGVAAYASLVVTRKCRKLKQLEQNNG